MSSTADQYSPSSVELVIGVEPVLLHREALTQAAAAWDQADEVQDLAYFFFRPERIRTIPHLVLLRAPSIGGGAADGGSILGAVVVFAYAGVLGATRLLLSSNRRGRRTVFAPVQHRVEVAAIAAQYLMERGARFVNIDIDMGPTQPPLPRPSPAWPRALATARLRMQSQNTAAYNWALHEGVKRFDLALVGDFDETVAPLGKRTRRNLRYYQRLCAHELGAVYEPRATPTLEQFLAMNPACSYPVTDVIARWRYASLQRFPNTFLAGLKDVEGTWLSLLGGRRNHGAVEIDWQMNRRGFERFSLTTAMRACLIEDEGAQGSTSLYAEGGTVHAMRDSFRFRYVYNLAARRPSLFLHALTAGLKRFLPGKTVSLALVKPWRNWNSSDLRRPATSPRHPG